MLRRISTQFKRDRKEKTNGAVSTNGVANANGTNGTNGHTNGVAEKSSRRKSSFGLPLMSKDKEGKGEEFHIEANRTEVNNVFTEFAQLIHTGNGPAPTPYTDGSNADHSEQHSSMFHDLKSLGFKDVKTLKELLQSKAKGDVIDDKTYLMERIIQLVSALPSTSKTRVDLTNAFIDELWESLQHPPLSYMGDKFTYRQGDGSYNNIMYPQIGAANTPYARTVQPMTVQPGALPDPGLIFDSIMARDTFTKNPNNVSSILFYWASLIIHDCFQTSHRDISISETSSYLDLSPLYGDTQADQDKIRTFKDGKLKPDCFAEDRMLAFPPGCGVLLIMFNRFHNYVVDQLAVINEGNRFAKPDSKLPEEMATKAWAKYDNDLFQTGRLITCGLYMNITLLDYLRTIVNLNRSNTTWTLDPRSHMEKVFGADGTPSGIGNQVSAEFNLVYRWHSCTSERDEKWTEELYVELFGKPASEVPMPELLQGLAKWFHSLDPDPHKRPFNKLQRQADGTFSDDDLVQILTESIEDVSGAFGARNVPKALKAVEILGMNQARKWGLATLNEFRKFFRLKPHDTFESINSDPEVAESLKNLYGHPDFVEMYPGLVAEEAKVPMVPGVGIAPTFTISRAILSDAVCLVRGDRFYTVDYHAKNLTNWGFQEASYDLNIEQGCVFYKLFLRAFPHHFKTNSIYAHYPMTIPSENKVILENLGRVSHYSWDRPTRILPRVNLWSYPSAKAVLENDIDFKINWAETTARLLGKSEATSTLAPTASDKIAKSLNTEAWQKEIKAFYEYITLKLLHEKKFKLAKINHVDITRDVGNLAPVHFASNIFSLPINDAQHPKGLFTDREMYTAFAVTYVNIFLDLDPARSFPLHMVGRKLAAILGKVIEGNVKAVNSTGWAGKTDGSAGLKDYGARYVRSLLEAGLTPDEAAWSQVFPAIVAMVPSQAQVFTQALDYYLSPAGCKHLPEINRLAKLDDSASDATLLRYILEGIRLNNTSGAFRQAAKWTSLTEKDGQTVDIKDGDKVFVSLGQAGVDANEFPDPHEVKLDRPLEKYIHFGVGPQDGLGKEASHIALTAMFKVIGRLDNLRRAPGPKGMLKKVPRPGGYAVYMREDYGSYVPFPVSMQINWDGELPPLPRRK